MKLLAELRAAWAELAHASPGARFQDQHRRRRESRSRHGHVAMLAGGVLLVALGAALIPTPGPGLVFLVVGGALIARESGTAARLLDRLELRLRRLVRRRP